MLSPEIDMFTSINGYVRSRNGYAVKKKNHVLVSNGYVSYCLMVICLSVGWSYVLVSDGHMS